ncbi:MAG: Maf family protein [Proteobacteria bacterium]|nr:Maf family protein [Pseudomonadota bacterium]MDA1331473.1 Maf family protein [Pseudomonadota bacterium]
MSDFFYLASQSPRREEILNSLRAPYRLLKLVEGSGDNADFDETPIPSEMPIQYVNRVSLIKASAAWKHLVAHHLEKAPVLAVDTTVSIDDKILGKPEGAEDARLMLQCLSGREHQVLTAVTMKQEGEVHQTLSMTTVCMQSLSERDIENYIQTTEPFGKSGSYGIQGIASIFITHISGSHSGVVGLPIYETSELIKKFGFALL